MRWRRDWSAKPPRPKVRRLPTAEQERLQEEMTKEIARSPVLAGFGIQVRLLRGRFYIERPFLGIEIWGRITPVSGELLLEVKRRSWKKIVTGGAKKLIQGIADDSKGTFHGLGSLDRSLRKAGHGLTRLPMKVQDKKFVYSDTGDDCTVQETLFHYFGLPIEVIAEPAVWYEYHRTPQIVGFSEDRVLVRFTAEGLSGTFGGTCLYAQRDGKWGAYRIRPMECRSIPTAEAWLVKRKWKEWG